MFELGTSLGETEREHSALFNALRTSQCRARALRPFQGGMQCVQHFSVHSAHSALFKTEPSAFHPSPGRTQCTPHFSMQSARGICQCRPRALRPFQGRVQCAPRFPVQSARLFPSLQETQLADKASKARKDACLQSISSEIVRNLEILFETSDPWVGPVHRANSSRNSSWGLLGSANEAH